MGGPQIAGGSLLRTQDGLPNGGGWDRARPGKALIFQKSRAVAIVERLGVMRRRAKQAAVAGQPEERFGIVQQRRLAFVGLERLYFGIHGGVDADEHIGFNRSPHFVQPNIHIASASAQRRCIR